MLFIFIIISWGVAWPINKIGLEYMPALWYTSFRLIVGTSTMMLLVIACKKFSLPNLRDIPLIFVIGILQISAYILLANIGLSYLPPGRSALLAYTTPLWVMPIATFFFREEVGVYRWTGFTLGILGLLILLSPWQLNWSNPKILMGSGMLLLASLSWAISMLCVRYMKWNKSPLELIPWQLLLGTIPIVILTITQEPTLHNVQWNVPLILSLAFTGILVTGISYWSGVIINKELPTIVVSLGFLIVPVVSLLVSAYTLHEVITLPTVAAVMLIVLGIGFVVA